MEKILVLWSGGVDSTGVLYKCLTEHKDLDVHAHHINLINATMRYKAESQACFKMIDWFHQRDLKFEYSESTMDLSFLPRIPWDTETCWSMAGIIARSIYDIKYIEAGRHGEDPHASANPRIVNRIDNTIAISTSTEKRGYKPAINLPICQHMPKRDIWVMLPDDLKDLVWYCRLPVYRGELEIPEACGTCHTCEDVETIKEKIKNGAV